MSEFLEEIMAERDEWKARALQLGKDLSGLAVQNTDLQKQLRGAVHILSEQIEFIEQIIKGENT